MQGLPPIILPHIDEAAFRPKTPSLDDQLYPPLNTDEEHSLLSRLGQKALSGLGYVGATLDKTFGARAIRGLLGGKLREGLSAIPFSDTLGITDPNDTVYGRDLLEKAGVIGPSSPGFDWGDVAGFATDVALDPASWLHPFPRTFKGAAAAKQGFKPAGLGNAMRGADYSEQQLAKLGQHLGTDAASVTPRRGVSVLPSAAEAELANRGVNIEPRFQRTATPSGPATPLPLPPPSMVSPPTIPPTDFRGAMEHISNGYLPPPGKYTAVSGDTYHTIHVGPAGASLEKGALENAANQAPDALRAALGVGLPFGTPRAYFGTGPTAQKVGDFLSGAGGWLRGTSPIRHARALFDNPVGGALSKQGQELGSGVKRPLENAAVADALGPVFDLRREFEPMERLSAAEANRMLLRSIEGVPLPADAAGYAAELQARNPALYQELHAKGLIDPLAKEFQRIDAMGAQGQAANLSMRANEEMRAIPSKDLQDTVGYNLRRMEKLPPEPGQPGIRGFFMNLLGGGKRKPTAYGVGSAAQIKREEILRGFPQGTTQINDVLKYTDEMGQPLLTGPGRMLSDDEATNLFLHELTKSPTEYGVASKRLADVHQHLMSQSAPGGNLAQLVAGASNNPQAQAQLAQLAAEATDKAELLYKQARGLSDWTKGLDPRYGSEARNFFAEDPIGSLGLRAHISARVTSSADAVYHGIGQFAEPAGRVPDGVSVQDVLRKAGFTNGPAVSKQAEDLAAKALRLGDRAELANYAVPKELADDMAKWIGSWTRPQELEPVVRAFDKITNLTKAHLTSPFPAFHARNAVTGLYNMWRDGALDMEALKDASSLLQGKSIKSFSGQGMELDPILKELYTQRVAFRGGLNTDANRPFSQELTSETSRVPGRINKSNEELLSGLAEQAKPGAGKPLSDVVDSLGLGTQSNVEALKKQLGVNDLSGLGVTDQGLEDVLSLSKGDVAKRYGKGFTEGSLNPLDYENFIPVKQGRQLGNATEDWMRTAHYIAKRRQGFSPAEAAQAVTKYHFDYGDVTNFERTAMKRLIPFYTFSRKNLPPLLEDLATRPAKLAESIRGATAGSRDPASFVPPYIAEGTNIPLPSGDPNTARYISSFGMPFEDEFFKAMGAAGAGDFKRFFGNAIGGLNPYLKFPVEEATGVQLHTGRQLKDLRPQGTANFLGGGDEDLTYPLAQLFANSPASRVVSSIDKLVDPRKGVLPIATNLGTGARITDVDLLKQQEIAARSLIEEQLKNNPRISEWERLYVKPDVYPRLSGDELQTMRLYRDLQRKVEERLRLEKRPIVLGPLAQ